MDVCLRGLVSLSLSAESVAEEGARILRGTHPVYTTVIGLQYHKSRVIILCGTWEAAVRRFPESCQADVPLPPVQFA